MFLVRLVMCAGVLVSLLFPRTAYCYLDPGTGSYVLQVIAAAFLGLLFSAKILWGKIKSFFARFK
jgi:hypothetical protein